MWSYFSSKNISDNLTKRPSLPLPFAKSTVHGTNSVHFKGRLTWNNLSYFIKSSVSVFEFKRNLKTLLSIKSDSHLPKKFVLFA